MQDVQVNDNGTLAPSTNGIDIGRNHFLSAAYFSGLMDELRVYSRALSSNEVVELFEATGTTTTTTSTSSTSTTSTSSSSTTTTTTTSTIPVSTTTTVSSSSSSTTAGALIAMHSVDHGVYRAGCVDSPVEFGSNRVENTFAYPGSEALVSLLWDVSLPPGWTIADAEGDGAPVAQNGNVVFTGSLTNRPVRFSYLLKPACDADMTKDLDASAQYQFVSMVNPASVPVSPDPLALKRAHSADYQLPAWALDAVEISRVLAYWRAGGYHVDSAGLDGYAPGAGDTNGCPHSADYRPPWWRLDGLETARALAYWRGDCFEINPAGPDGYVPGCGGGGLHAGDFPAKAILSKPVDAASQDGPAMYEPGDVLIISNQFTFSDPILSLLAVVSVPLGWQITSVSGDGSPELNGTEVLWTALNLVSPVNWQYSVRVPDPEVGDKLLGASVKYFRTGTPGELSSDPVPPRLTIEMLDEDEDGIPDDLEQFYTGSTTGLVASADDDGDGLSNLEEAQLGSDLTNAQSVLVLEDVEVNVDELRIKWQSVTNRMYRVMASSNLMDGFIHLETNVVSTPPTNCVIVPPGPWRYFQIRLDP